MNFIFLFLLFFPLGLSAQSKIQFIPDIQCHAYDVLIQDHTAVKRTISELLLANGYQHDPNSLLIYPKQNLTVCIVETVQGKKFLKLHRRGWGISEMLGTFLLQDFVPVIASEKLLITSEAELLIQPFIDAAYKEGGMLYDAICQLEFEQNSETWSLVQLILTEMLQINCQTMDYSTRPARNDRLFFERLKTQEQDGISGRIEHYYKEKKFKIGNIEIGWEKLKHLRWQIDGVAYAETLEDLLFKAKSSLNPNQPRLIGISHGDWHEMNIAIHSPSLYSYLDLELAGENDLINDAVVYLTYTSIFGDYLSPKYFPQQFQGKNIVSKCFQKSLANKSNDFNISRGNDEIQMTSFGSFGTLKTHREMAHLFVKRYCNPLIEKAKNQFGNSFACHVENHLKAALLLRLIGVYNLTEMDSLDQARIFALIYKTIGTPSNGENNESVLTRFLNAL